MFCRLLDINTDIWNLYAGMNIKSSPGFFLDSSLYDKNLGRYSFAGWNPKAILRSKGRHIEYHEQGQWTSWQGDPLQTLEELRKKHLHLIKPVSGDAFPFNGGLVGYISYDMFRNYTGIWPKCRNDLQMYEQYWGVYDSFVVMDHAADQIWAVSYSEEKAMQMEEEIYKSLKGNGEVFPAAIKVGEIRSNFTRDEYLMAIHQVKDRIYKGEISQVNLSQRFSFKLEGSSQKFYDIIREISPGYFSAFLHFEDYDILSISPERYIKIKDKTIETRPIKGTRPRGSNAVEDRDIALELRNSSKDQAELTMIVDLEKKELEKICQAGSVTVKDLFRVTPYATVFHLDATVSGTMAGNVSMNEVLRHTFPGGSITGTPKQKAMQVIEALEPTFRGVYTGTIGYINFNGDCDLNIAIRTAVIKDQWCHYQAGGGLIAESDPEREYDETLDKAQAFFLSREELVNSCSK